MFTHCYKFLFILLFSNCIQADSSVTDSERKHLTENGLRRFLQPDDFGRNSDDTLGMYSTLCARDCIQDSEPRDCYYEFIVEHYHAMGPACENCPSQSRDCLNPQCVAVNGCERSILTVNRMIPGTGIHVCQRDRLIIDIYNRMPSRTLVFHWQGPVQTHWPWMTGASHITQCPIYDGQKFRYEFTAANEGTYFYRSSDIYQTMNGLSGPLIVRSNKLNEYMQKYDYDLPSHLIFLQDWTRTFEDGGYSEHDKAEEQKRLRPYSILINGKGPDTNPRSCVKEPENLPVAEFYVKRNYKYRFRIISALSLPCQIRFAIEDHYLTLLAVDGHFVQPVEVHALYMYSGSRFDVILKAYKKKPVYWIRVEGTNSCKNVFQIALLRYDAKNRELPKTENSRQLFRRKPLPYFNDIYKGCSGGLRNVCLEDLQSSEPTPIELRNPVADRYFKYKFSIRTYTLNEVISEDITFKKRFHQQAILNEKIMSNTYNRKICSLPSRSLLTEKVKIDDYVCPATCPAKKICYCLNIETVKKNSVVEIVFEDEILRKGTFKDAERKEPNYYDRVAHLHGHNMILIKQGNSDARLPAPVMEGRIRKKYHAMVNTITVPRGGYAVVRFKATNPGLWPLEYQLTYHNQNSIVAIFRVAEDDIIPHPEEFPKCNDYLPAVQIP